MQLGYDKLLLGFWAVFVLFIYSIKGWVNSSLRVIDVVQIFSGPPPPSWLTLYITTISIKNPNLLHYHPELSMYYWREDSYKHNEVDNVLNVDFP